MFHRPFCATVPYVLIHTQYMVDCMSVCVYNLALESHWGGGGDAAGVFALAAIQHSTFLSDIQYYDLKKPVQQRNTLIFYVPPLCRLLSTLKFWGFFILLPSTLYSCLHLGSHLSTLTPSQTWIYLRLLKVSHCSKFDHKSCCCYEKFTTLFCSLNVSQRHIFFLY